MHAIILITIAAGCLYVVTPKVKHKHSIDPEDVLMFGENAKCECKLTIKEIGI